MGKKEKQQLEEIWQNLTIVLSRLSILFIIFLGLITDAICMFGPLLDHVLHLAKFKFRYEFFLICFLLYNVYIICT